MSRKPEQKPKRMIPACSGASKVGQLSNQAAVELTREGFGQMFCLAAIRGHLPKFVNYAKKVPNMSAIDGCPVGCIRSIPAHAEVPLGDYIVLSELGFEKNMNSKLGNADIEKVERAVRNGIQDSASLSTRKPADGGCCGS